MVGRLYSLALPSNVTYILRIRQECNVVPVPVTFRGEATMAMEERGEL